jgi:hypothetical protein
MKNKLGTYFLIILIVAILPACNNVSPTPIATKNSNSVNMAYPMPEQVNSTAYPIQIGGNKIAPEAVSVPKEAPIPEKDKASVSGVLYSKGTSTILSKFRLYLTPAQGEDKNHVPPVLLGPFADKGDYIAITDNNGNFEINNLPPGNYFIVVDMTTDYEVAVKQNTNDTPRMVTLTSNQRNPLGLVIVP